jgi:uncharacterized membrane protein (DUF485 family)
MENLLNKEVEYKIIDTSLGQWRSYMDATGRAYHEFTSHMKLFNLPLIHYTSGICPETGRRKIAKGIIAVGRTSIGVLAIGQLSAGLIAIGQISIALLLAFAQVCLSVIAIGQFTIGLYFAIGQIAFGYIAIGQFAMGYYILAQAGFGKYVWSVSHKDPQAVEFFKMLLKKLTH